MIELEKQLIDKFKMHAINIELLCKTEGELQLLQIIKSTNFWEDWVDASAHNAPPPDFYSDKYKIMMDVMKVEDNTRRIA